MAIKERVNDVLTKDGIGTIHKLQSPVSVNSGKKSRYVLYDPIEREFKLCSRSGNILSKEIINPSN